MLHLTNSSPRRTRPLAVRVAEEAEMLLLERLLEVREVVRHHRLLRLRCCLEGILLAVRRLLGSHLGAHVLLGHLAGIRCY